MYLQITSRCINILHCGKQANCGEQSKMNIFEENLYRYLKLELDKSECKDEKLNIRIVSNNFMSNKEAIISDNNKYTNTTNNSRFNVN